MKKATILLVLCFVITSIIAPKTAPATTPSIIRIGTHPVGAFFNVVGSAVGKVIGAHTPMKAKVMPMSGPPAWMPMMVRGEIDLGMAAVSDGYWGYMGEERYEKISKGKGFPLRLVLTGIYNDVSVITSKDSGIKTLKDLRGKKMSGGYTNVRSSHYICLAALATAGLTIDDVKLLPVVNPPAGVKALIEGRVDAAGVATTGMPQVRELAANKGALFLGLDTSPEAKARARKFFPHGWFNLVKGGKFPGVDVDTWLMRFEIYVLCRDSLSEDVVYTIMKTMWDCNSDLAPIHPKFKVWKRQNYASRLLMVPYHPGSVKFLQEKGLWTSELKKRQNELLSVKK